MKKVIFETKPKTVNINDTNPCRIYAYKVGGRAYKLHNLDGGRWAMVALHNSEAWDWDPRGTAREALVASSTQNIVEFTNFDEFRAWLAE